MFPFYSQMYLTKASFNQSIILYAVRLERECEKSLETGVLIKTVYLVYYLFFGSRAEVVLRPILLPDSVERVLEPGALFR